MLKKIITSCIIASAVTTVFAANLVQSGRPISGQHDGSNLKELGTFYTNTKSIGSKLIHLTDSSLSTCLDTYNSRSTASHSFFGVLWTHHSVSDVTKVSIAMNIYKDGGWFGKNGFLPHNKKLLINQAVSENTHPVIQVTNDLGKSWKTVKTKSNYLAKVNNQRIKKTPTTISDITFEIEEPIANINGIRIIGTEGGNALDDINGFVALSDFKVDGSKSELEIIDGNIAVTGTALMGIHSGKGIDKLGTVFHNGIGRIFNIIDGDPKTSCDTWKPVRGKNIPLPYSFVGVTWDKPVKETVTQLQLTLNTHFDGGWFGTNYSSPAPDMRLGTNHISETSVPLLQVTYDKGSSWKIVSNKNDYLAKMVGHKIGNEITPSTVTINFSPEIPLSNIDGVRLIGSEGGGMLKKDANGFISVAEFKVLTSETDSQISSGVKCDLTDNELSWEVENEGWIKEYRVINNNTNEAILVTPAVEADIYSMKIASGISPKLQIVDKYDKVHEIDPNEQ